MCTYFRSVSSSNITAFSTLPRFISHFKHFTYFDTEYLYDPKNFDEISNNVRLRKGIGDIKIIKELKEQLDDIDPQSADYDKIKRLLFMETNKIPNRTHPRLLAYDEEPKILKHIGSERRFEFTPRQFYEITKRLNLVRTDQLGNLSGTKSYYLLGEMAEFEQALIKFTLNQLLRNNFKLISVPDVLPRNIIESCGMNTRGSRTQVIFKKRV